MKKIKLEVTDEFIKDAYEVACPEWQEKIKQLAPEVFETNFKPGDWVRLLSDYGTMKKGDIVPIVKLQSTAISYWVVDHTIYDDCSAPFLAPHKNAFIKATELEITDALSKEACKRFNDGDTFLSAWWDSPNPRELFTFDGSKGFRIKKTSGSYGVNLLANAAYGSIFFDGKWATPAITKEEAEKKLGQIISC